VLARDATLGLDFSKGTVKNSKGLLIPAKIQGLKIASEFHFTAPLPNLE